MIEPTNTAKHKLYPAYNKSSVEWLGDIPAQWMEKRLKFLISDLESGNRETGGGNQLDEGVYSIGGEHIGWNGKFLLNSPKFISDEFYEKLGKGKIKQEDVLLVKDGATIGKTAYVVNVPCGISAVNEHVFILRADKNTFAKFLYYLISSKLGFEQICLQKRGSAQPGLKSSFINIVIFPFPAKFEQRSIANFLDHHTAKIDALIAKKERLIELLEEKRTAIISQAVTKGLNPDVEMNDSGIPAIGEIPSHWAIDKNKKLFFEVQDRSETGDEELLTVSHITGITPRAEKEVNMFMAESMEGYKRCFPGDLVINTMWAWMGALGISSYDGIVSPSYHVYRLKNNKLNNPKYLDYFYRTPEYIVEINRYSKGVWKSRLRLYPSEFFEMTTIIPPIDEQYQIVSFLEEEISHREKLIKKLRNSINLLQEHRSALISAAVTGKIDVREWND